MQIAEKLSATERDRFYKLVKFYEKKPYPSVVHQLEGFGAAIDEKDYGADQGIERGTTEF